MSHLLASIDQGTNTLRLLVVDAATRPPAELAREQRIVRLGGGFARRGRLADEARARTLAAWEEYAQILQRLGCTDVRAVGTGVLRQAPDAGEFVESVRSRTGLALAIIAGEREAELSVKGALAALGVGDQAPETYLVADVGGGSTELALCRGGATGARVSVPVGVVSLLETELPSDPPAEGEVCRARRRLRQSLAAAALVRQEAAGGGEFTLVGCSGTFTTLAALAQGLRAYEPAQITGFSLRAEHLGALLGEALRLRARERLARWPVLPPGREDVIVSGLILCQEILTFLGRERVLISDGGLLEGVLLQRLAEL